VKISAVHQPREQRRIWLEMAQTNASLQLARLLAEEGSQQARTRALAQALDLAVEDLDATARRVFRYLAHGRRGDPGLVCGVPEPPDAVGRVPPLHDRGHHTGRRLRGHAAGADTRRYSKVAEALRESW
jgi:excinuclease ABC subunit C